MARIARIVVPGYLHWYEPTAKSPGSDLFIDKLEVLLGKLLGKKKTGSKGPWGNRGNK